MSSRPYVVMSNYKNARIVELSLVVEARSNCLWCPPRSPLPPSAYYRTDLLPQVPFCHHVTFLTFALKQLLLQLCVFAISKVFSSLGIFPSECSRPECFVRNPQIVLPVSGCLFSVLPSRIVLIVLINTFPSYHFPWSHFPFVRLSLYKPSPETGGCEIERDSISPRLMTWRISLHMVTTVLKG